jgi:antitoxin component YwqK of YwqJK toxin-antitoxin module
MKKLLPILFVLIITSCSKEVGEDQVYERNGMTYEVNSRKLFSGKLVTNWWDNSLPETIVTYKKGMRNGSRVMYYRNGQLRQETFYKDGERICGHEQYHENSQLSVKRTPNLYEQFSENGKLLIRKPYKNRKQHGLHEWYHENGELKEKRMYKDGLIYDEDLKKPLNGTTVSFHDNGNIDQKITIEDGVMSGPYYTYHRNGKVRTEGIQKEGEPYGHYKWFDESGQFIERDHYNPTRKKKRFFEIDPCDSPNEK